MEFLWEWYGVQYYDVSWKIAASILGEVIVFLKMAYSFQPHYGPGFDSASNGSEYQKYSWG
jgi:hypothetical protein